MIVIFTRPVWREGGLLPYPRWPLRQHQQLQPPWRGELWLVESAVLSSDWCRSSPAAPPSTSTWRRRTAGAWWGTRSASPTARRSAGSPTRRCWSSSWAPSCSSSPPSPSSSATTTARKSGGDHKTAGIRRLSSHWRFRPWYPHFYAPTFWPLFSNYSSVIWNLLQTLIVNTLRLRACNL